MKYHIRNYFEGIKPIPLCNSKTEDIMVVATEDYFAIHNLYPNICCEVCLNSFKKNSPVRYAELMKAKHQSLSKTF